MNVVDSSCWLEFFSGSSVGDKVSPIIENTELLIVPSITIYEVFKKILIELDEDKALLAIAHMKQGHVIDLNSEIAVYAAKIGNDHQLAMADSIIYSICKKFNATLWTQDKHFKLLENVKYFDKEK
jgi:predicted nucleic acid-binding protein